MFLDLRAIYKDDTVNMCKTFYTFLHGLLSITAEGRWLYLFFTVISNGQVKLKIDVLKFYFTTPMM